VYVVNCWLMLQDARFSQGKREMARFYIAEALPVIQSKAARIRGADPSLLQARILVQMAEG
jgi:hypothetical protein